MKKTSTWIIIILVITVAVFAYLKMNKSANNEEANEGSDEAIAEQNNENVPAVVDSWVQEAWTGDIATYRVYTGESISGNNELLQYDGYDFSFQYPKSYTLYLEDSGIIDERSQWRRIFMSTWPYKDPANDDYIFISITEDTSPGQTSFETQVEETISGLQKRTGAEPLRKNIPLGNKEGILIIPVNGEDGKPTVQGNWALVMFIQNYNSYTFVNSKAENYETFLKLLQSFKY